MDKFKRLIFFSRSPVIDIEEEEQKPCLVEFGDPIFSYNDQEFNLNELDEDEIINVPRLGYYTPEIKITANGLEDNIIESVKLIIKCDLESNISDEINMDYNSEEDFYHTTFPKNVDMTYFYFEADCEGEGAEKTRIPETGYYRYNTISSLDYLRGPYPYRMNLTAGSPAHMIYRYWNGTQWVQDGSKRDESWYFWRCFYSAGEADSILLQNRADAYLRSPRMEGIGTLYFKVKPLSIVEGEEHRLEIQTSPDRKNPWTTVETFVVPSILKFMAYSVELNDYSPSLFVRIARVSVSEDASCQLALRDIRVSPPPADVILSETKNDNEFILNIEQKSDDYPALCLNPKIWYRVNDEEAYWQNLEKIDDNTYKAIIDNVLDYYYVVNFCGLSFKYDGNDENKSPRYLNWSPRILQPIAWYEGEENANDSSGNDYHLVKWRNDHDYIDGIAGKAFNLIENDLFGNSIGPSGFNDFTISLWFKLHDIMTGTWQYLVSVYNPGGGQRSWGVAMPSVSKGLGLILSNNGSDWQSDLAFLNTNELNINQFYLLTWVRQDDKISLFLDGSFKSTSTYSGTLYNSNAALAIGRAASGNFNTNKYSIDDVLIFDRALSETEIQQLYEISLKQDGKSWQ